MGKDEHGIVLDFLEQGRGGVGDPVAQVIGTSHFSLLEVVPRENTTLKPGEEVYIGSGDREKIKYIKDRIDFTDLTANAKAEIDLALETIIDDNEDRFVDFFNDSPPITTRMHSLELLPGLGKKHTRELLDAREKEPFTSFAEMKERVELIPNPKTVLKKRIKEELDGDEKYYLFVTGKRDTGQQRSSR